MGGALPGVGTHRKLEFDKDDSFIASLRGGVENT
jgi:hypothetical protein